MAMVIANAIPGAALQSKKQNADSPPRPTHAGKRDESSGTQKSLFQVSTGFRPFFNSFRAPHHLIRKICYTGNCFRGYPTSLCPFDFVSVSISSIDSDPLPKHLFLPDFQYCLRQPFLLAPQSQTLRLSVSSRFATRRLGVVHQRLSHPVRE